jgi:probable rRNA maturation factor
LRRNGGRNVPHPPPARVQAVNTIPGVLEIEILGGDGEERGAIGASAPGPGLRRAALAALAAAGVERGHLAITLVSEDEIRRLNHQHRGIDRPTDVLSFPVDRSAPVAGPRELGDVVICEEHAEDLIEATVHGVLHVCGYDHETDGGEMLALQRRVLAGLR